MSKRATFLCLALAGCGARPTPAPPPAPEATPPAPEAAPPTAPAPATEAASPTLDAAQRKAWLGHVRAGRELAQKKRWADAAAAFERALEVLPEDGRTLSELGWVAFQAGDLATARDANARAVRQAADPNVRASGLYNLGRVAEATNDRATAERLYRESLALRPNATVEARLRALGADPAPPPAEPSPCAGPRPLDALCACLAEHAPEAGTGLETERACAPLDKPAAPGLRIVRVDHDLVESNFYVAHETAGGWAAIGDVGYFFAGGVGGVYNGVAFPSIKVFSLGPARVARVEITNDHSDTDLGIAEGEASTTVDVLFCVLERPGGGAPSCPVRATLSHEYERDRLEDVDPNEIIADLATPGLPVREAYENEVRLSPDGVVTVTRVGGGAVETHRLW